MDIIRAIEQYAGSQPTHTAYRSRSGEITYKELWDRSGQLAARIAAAGLPDRQPIPVYGHKEPFMPVCFLACVRSGHPYIPLDVNMPECRIRDIIEAAECPLLLAAENPGFTIPGVRIIRPEMLRALTLEVRTEERPNPRIRVSGDDPYYIIYTSGSTGKPKGVQVSTRNLNSFLEWSVRLAGGVPGVFLNQAPFSFDLSVMDLYTGFATGSAVAAIDRDLIRGLPRLLEFLKKNHPNYWVSTPSFANMVLRTGEFHHWTFPTLRKFFFCGEPLKKHTALRLSQRFPTSEIINTYGPTETTVCVTSVKITRQMLREEGDLPVGTAKPGTEIYAADPEGRRLGPGEAGELIIAGSSVTLGYSNNPEKTEASYFVSDEGERAFRTGDLGYVDEYGMVYCSGRMDGQVKLHGYRIELGDIEKNLTQLRGIENAAVFLRKKEGHGEALAACILQDPEEDTSYERRKWVRQSLKERIPSYMVPSRILFFHDFPMTMNGKLDRRKLEEMI